MLVPLSNPALKAATYASKRLLPSLHCLAKKLSAAGLEVLRRLERRARPMVEVCMIVSAVVVWRYSGLDKMACQHFLLRKTSYLLSKVRRASHYYTKVMLHSVVGFRCLFQIDGENLKN